LWYRHAKLHRDGGLPAVIRTGANGAKEWYWMGKLHREKD